LVWKSIVVNTPRTLRECLSALIEKILELLASPVDALASVAGRCLGDVVLKLGERVLPQVLPILSRAFESGNAKTRRAVCLGVREVVASTNNKSVEEHIDLVLRLVLASICDADADVRAAAAEAFETMQRRLGQQVVHLVIPSVLEQLNDGDAQRRAVALDGLRGILSLRGHAIMPLLVPKLVNSGATREGRRPLTSAQVEAIEAAAAVPESKDWMPQFLKEIVPALLTHLCVERRVANDSKISGWEENLDDEDSKASIDQIRSAAERCVVCVGSRGLRRLTDVLGEAFRKEDNFARAEAARLTATFFRKSESDFDDLVPHFLREVLQLYVETDTEILTAALDAMNAIEARVGKEALGNHVDFIRQSISNIVSSLKHRKSGSSLPRDEDGNVLLPGVCQKKGLKPFLATLQHALHRGPQRQEAAKLYADLVRLTDKANLKPFLIKITGPLIRGVGDRFQSNVKVAILQALTLVLDKGGARLKPFLPQLHTTFVKGLHGDSELVRKSAAEALDKLVLITTRVDPLVKDLCGHVENAFDDEDGNEEIRAGILSALSSVLEKIGDKVKPAVLQLAISTLSNVRGAPDDIESRIGIAEGLAKCAINMSDDDFESYVGQLGAFVRSHSTESDWNVRHAHALEVAATSRFVGGRLSKAGVLDVVLEATLSLFEDDNVLVQTSAATSLLALAECDALSQDASLITKAKRVATEAFESTSNSRLRSLCQAVLKRVSSPGGLESASKN